MNRSLRVIMLLQSYYPRLGGAERQVASLAPLLRTLGVEVTVITRRYAGFKPFEIVDGVPIYRIATPGAKPLGALLFTLGALFLIARLRPDVVHAHELLSPTTTALAARKIFGVPAVVKILCGGMLGDVAKVKRRSNARLWFSSMSRNISAFIVISDEIDRELDEVGIPPNKRLRISNGVDTNLFRPADSPQDVREELGIDGSPVAVFTGRLEPEKNLDVLLGAWNTVHDFYSNSLLLIIGEGTELEKLRLIASPSVRFVGRVDNTAPFLQAADVFVLPSNREGISNALLEAMSTGLAVIATDVGGVQDVITNGTSGQIIAPGDTSVLASAIIGLFANSEARQRLGYNARNRIAKEYTLCNTADKLCSLYEKLMMEHKL